MTQPKPSPQGDYGEAEALLVEDNDRLAAENQRLTREVERLRAALEPMPLSDVLVALDEKYLRYRAAGLTWTDKDAAESILFMPHERLRAALNPPGEQG